MQQKINAAFLDRDGVLNHERDYLYKVEDFKFIDGVIDALKNLQSKNYAFLLLQINQELVVGIIQSKILKLQPIGC